MCLAGDGSLRVVKLVKIERGMRDALSDVVSGGPICRRFSITVLHDWIDVGGSHRKFVNPYGLTTLLRD